MGQQVVVGGGEQFNGCSCSQIRTAYANDNQHLGIGTDFLGSTLDAPQLLSVYLLGQLEPTQKVLALPRALMKRSMGGVQLWKNGTVLPCRDKFG